MLDHGIWPGMYGMLHHAKRLQHGMLLTSTTILELFRLHGVACHYMGPYQTYLLFCLTRTFTLAHGHLCMKAAKAWFAAFSHCLFVPTLSGFHRSPLFQSCRSPARQRRLSRLHKHSHASLGIDWVLNVVRAIVVPEVPVLAHHPFHLAPQAAARQAQSLDLLTQPPSSTPHLRSAAPSPQTCLPWMHAAQAPWPPFHGHVANGFAPGLEGSCL